MEVPRCQPLPAWISKILKDLQEGDGGSSRALSGETSMGQLRSHKANQHFKTLPPCPGEPREGPGRAGAQGETPRRAQRGPGEGPGRAQGRSREGPGKTQGGGPGTAQRGPRGDGRPRAEAARRGIIPTSHLAPQTSHDAKRQSLNQSKDQLKLICSKLAGRRPAMRRTHCFQLC